MNSDVAQKVQYIPFPKTILHTNLLLLLKIDKNMVIKETIYCTSIIDNKVILFFEKNLSLYIICTHLRMYIYFGGSLILHTGYCRQIFRNLESCLIR